MFLFDALVFLIAITLSIGISVLISQPFNGAIVRLRANYLPKAVSLDNVLEDGAGSTSGPRALSSFLLSERRSTAKIGPVVTGVFSMMLRTKRLEGWAGIYKGSIPVAIQIFTLSSLTFIFFSGASGSSPGSAYKAGPAGPGQFSFFANLFYMLFVSIAALPLNVITYRTIVHPRILPLNNARENLRELLSYTEFSQPWRLYLLPGLLAANVAHVMWIGLATRIVRQLTVPSLGGLGGAAPAGPGDATYSGPNSNMLEISPVGLPIFILWNVISVIVLAPLECAMVRLSTQRPEKQNPLHRAYARVPANGNGAPSPYSHQATAAAQAQPGGAYRDADTRKSTDGASDKPLPSSPDLPGRASFAIGEEDDEDGDVGATKPASTNGKSARVLGQTTPDSAPAPSNFPSQPTFSGGEPPEPVIALRPIEEQTAQEAAAEFGAPVVKRYEGLVDCFNKMVDEEGIESLGRGAWVTLIAMFAGSFS
ncbi:Mitochondrial carrier domain protein [Kalmanozyma brasiliensis GHG001]|uniref:Mitochondrial carrier protein n=1 Tax=Kalmanozyma brasiliensis (strain GHG001) TaxID=1365824 RepID=V5ET85_KALBG|nr:Mitochondrial carrier domain protein [Kalmanozyma brasiliensis GHG001]EST08470.1 Mitochondrial carrier domain protein [Kalmanozyma brasiliensis GHG001]